MLGEFSGDRNAEVAAGFFTARHAALASDGAETADLKAVTTPQHFKKSSAFVTKNAGKQKATTVTVVGVEGGSVDVCAGPKGTNARTLTIEGGKVAANAKGQHTCK